MTEKLRDILIDEGTLTQTCVYSDSVCVALLSKNPISLCHVIITPRREVTILEQLQDEEVTHIFGVANLISRAMFESINIQGTNILVQNGVPAGQNDPQFSIHVISRTENDEVPVDWEPMTVSDEQMESVKQLYEQTLGKQAQPVPQQEQVPVKKTKPDVSSEDGEENYLVKYFERRP
ncbi:MAG: HIT family protein [Candidatus Woesearchaeota archaeon]